MKKTGLRFTALLLVGILTVSAVLTGCGNSAKDEEIEELKAKLEELEKTEEAKEPEKEEPAEAEEGGREVESEAEEPEEEEEAYDPAADEALWGTKRPISSEIQSGGKTLEMKYEYNDEGSYTGRIQDESFDYVYYYCANGIPIRKETYFFSSAHPEGELEEDIIVYFMKGVPITGNDTCIYKFYYGGGIYSSASYNRDMFKLDYDKEGDITNDGIFYDSDKSKERIWIERDDQGRISKIITDETPGLSDDHEEKNYKYTEWVYEDDSLTCIGYNEQPNKYDPVARTNGIKQLLQESKAVFDTHGAVVHFASIWDGKERDSYDLKYDVYGNIVSVTKGSELIVKIENTYEDGTVTSLDNDGGSGSSAKSDDSESISSSSRSGDSDIVGKWVGVIGVGLSDYTFFADGTGEEYFNNDGETTYFNWDQKGTEISITNLTGDFETLELKDGMLYDMMGNGYEKQ